MGTYIYSPLRSFIYFYFIHAKVALFTSLKNFCCLNFFFMGVNIDARLRIPGHEMRVDEDGLSTNHLWQSGLQAAVKTFNIRL